MVNCEWMPDPLAFTPYSWAELVKRILAEVFEMPSDKSTKTLGHTVGSSGIYHRLIILASGPAQCRQYNRLDWEGRNQNKATYAEGSVTYCDRLNWKDKQSPDWRGVSWYRFVGKAGKKMPQSPPEVNRCGSNAVGWNSGTLPPSGETYRTTYCFSWSNKDCK